MTGTKSLNSCDVNYRCLHLSSTLRAIFRSFFGWDVRGPRCRWADLSDILPANQRASYIDDTKTIENDGMDIVNKHQLTIVIVLISFPSLITAITPSTGKSSFAAKKSIRFSRKLFLKRPKVVGISNFLVCYRVSDWQYTPLAFLGFLL